MIKNTMAILTVICFTTLVALAIAGWRRRTAAQEQAFDEPFEALEFFGVLIGQAKSFYVATTFSSNHLERISAYGLGSRGIAQLLIFSEGVLIVRNGERPLSIDKSQIVAITTNQIAIDKAVEADGLISIDWLQNSTGLSTHLRITDQASRELALSSISSIISSNSSREFKK